MSIAASNDPAVVMASELLSECREAFRKRTDLVDRQTHRLARMQAHARTCAFLHRMRVDGETLRTKLLRNALRSRLVRQRQEKIQLVRLKWIDALFSQLSNQLRIEILAPFCAAPAHREIDAQGRQGQGSQDQGQQPLHRNLPFHARESGLYTACLDVSKRAGASTRGPGSA